MKLFFYLLALATPIAATILAFIAIPPATPGDFLAYVLVGAMAELCAMASLLPSAHASEGDPPTLDVPETLSVLPPADPGDEWDTEETWALPRHWLWEDEQ